MIQDKFIYTYLMMEQYYQKYYAKLTRPPKKTKIIKPPKIEEEKHTPFPLGDVPSDIRTQFLCSYGFLDHETALGLSSLSKGLRENIYLCTNLKITLISDATLAFIKRFNNLKSLNLSESNVQDLDLFVQRFPQLEKLILHNCYDITSFTPLGSLRNLNYLNLDETHVTDLNFLTTLTQLKKLSLFNCKDITSFEQLNRLTTLTVLIISYTNFNSIELIASLNNLLHLDLSGTEITDLAPIVTLVNLIHLNLTGTEITDLAPLERLLNLRHLNLSGMYITNLESFITLRTLVNLSYLDLSETEITNLAPLVTLVNLRHLDLSKTSIEDLSPIEHLLNLQYLNLSKTHITNITVFLRINEILSVNMEDSKKISQLRYLNLSDTTITDISPLSVLTLLEVLELSNLKIENVDALESMINLISFKLSYTNENIVDSTFTSIGGLRNCKKLQKLDLSGCDKIVNFDILFGLNKLLDLNLSRSRIPLSIINQFNKLKFLKILNIFLTTIERTVYITILKLPKTITELTCGDLELQNISFLSTMINLEKLCLTNVAHIRDFSPLKKLVNLKYLVLYNINITNYTLLPINLEELKLIDCVSPNLQTITLSKLQKIYLIRCYTDNTINLEMLYSFILRHLLLNLIEITLNEQNKDNIRKFVAERNLHIEIV